jgi:tape measure domain-containing protein
MDYRQTFTIDLRDLYGQKLDKLAAKSDKQFERIKKGIGGLSKAGRQASRSIDDIDKRIKSLNTRIRFTVDLKSIETARREIRALEKEKNRMLGIRSGGGMGIGGMITGAGAILGLGGIGRMIGQASRSFMNYEATKTSFGVLAGDNQVGEALANRLNKFQQETILGPEVFKSAQTLMAFGVTAKEVEKTIQQLGAVSMGNADRFQMLTLAFAQTRSAGKLMGQDLLQYVNAGFNPLQTISEKWKEFGFNSKKSVGELRKEMEKGNISSEMVAKAFDIATSKGGKFDGMLDKVGKTSFGIWAQLSGQMEGLQIAAGERFEGAIKGTGMLLSAVVGKVKQWFEIPLDQKLRQEANDLRVLKSELNDVNISADRRKEILKQINERYGQYLKNLNLEKASYEEIQTALNGVVELLEKKAQRAFLDKALETARGDYGSLIERRTAVYTGIRQTAAKYGANDLLNMSGITEEERINRIYARLHKKDPMSGELLMSGEEYSDFNTYFTVQRQLKRSKENLDKTTKDINQQLQQEGLLGINNDDALTGGSNSGGGSGKGSGGFDTAGINSVNGGSSVKNIYISIGNLVNGGVNVHTTTLKDGVSKAKDIIIEGLLTAVNDANLAGGNQ